MLPAVIKQLSDQRHVRNEYRLHTEAARGQTQSSDLRLMGSSEESLRPCRDRAIVRSMSIVVCVRGSAGSRTFCFDVRRMAHAATADCRDRTQASSSDSMNKGALRSI